MWSGTVAPFSELVQHVTNVDDEDSFFWRHIDPVVTRKLDLEAAAVILS